MTPAPTAAGTPAWAETSGQAFHLRRYVYGQRWVGWAAVPTVVCLAVALASTIVHARIAPWQRALWMTLFPISGVGWVVAVVWSRLGIPARALLLLVGDQLAVREGRSEQRWPRAAVQVRPFKFMGVSGRSSAAATHPGLEIIAGSRSITIGGPGVLIEPSARFARPPCYWAEFDEWKRLVAALDTQA